MRLPCDAVLHSNNISLYQKDEMASNAKTKVTTAFERTKPENKSKAKPNKPSTKLALTDLRDCRCVLEHDPVSEGVQTCQLYSSRKWLQTNATLRHACRLTRELCLNLSNAEDVLPEWSLIGNIVWLQYEPRYYFFANHL